MDQKSNIKMLSRLMFRLLPVQILLAGIGAVNGLVSSFFASRYVGIHAMSAVGVYFPLNMFLTSLSTVLVGGSIILCGEHLGRNEHEKMQGIFSLNMLLSVLVSAVAAVLFLCAGLFDLTGFLTRDPVVRPFFNRYLIGQAVGVLPLLLGASLAAFLLLENRGKRTIIASLAYIAANLALNYLFVQRLRMEAFGLALASSLGMWVFLLVQAQFYLSGKSMFRFRIGKISWKESGDIFRIGFPGAASNLYQTARGLIVNRLLETFVGSVGISAFAASDSVMRIFWAILGGMLAVSRLLFSVSIGEEDRQTLADVMRVVFRRYIPLMCAVCLMIILSAVPLSRIFFQNPDEPVFSMTAWGFRILPFCMPLSIINMNFVCYGQASGKQFLVHLLSLLDGVVCVAGFSALLIRGLGINGVYTANVLNGVVTTVVIVAYSWIRNRHIPRNMEELMVIPNGFGTAEDERMDLSVHSAEEVVKVSERVQNFCLFRGVDQRRAFLAGLSMEEMAGNIVEHGYTKDRKKHDIDVRVVHRKDEVILRIKDDCVPFDPRERKQMAEGSDPAKNIGIRMVFRIARDVQYQNILGLNVLTIRI